MILRRMSKVCAQKWPQTGASSSVNRVKRDLAHKSEGLGGVSKRNDW